MSRGGFQQLFEWAAKLAYLNLLWIIYTLMGLLVLGAGPATVSLFTILRQMLRGNDHDPIWQTFHRTYRQEFWKANQLMIPIYLVGGFIYLDFMFIQALPYSFLIDNIVFPALLLLTVLFILAAGYLFTAYVHVDVSSGIYIKYALVMIGLYPLFSILMFFSLSIFAVVLFIFPAILPFYGVSIAAFIVISCASRAFDSFISAKNIQKEPIDKKNHTI
ncbi:DUF624 domain-containing protein [Gracilibacillus alcaliphilus]|uniref:DUF624 domain-containing protein n=1 Tax=Gracilibacillus alcaliphilus TaxID=1401441 RepID=UPI0019594894|nr:putative membrane protein YesL [Gracilibacillus alcaliphilus]